ncbi:MAG: hypothetical protein ACPGJV_09340 [Bacteriovoracaceae bacterium]
MEGYLVWFQNHALQIGVGGLTLVLMYLYVIERDTGVKLSKRYRNSIYEAQSKVFLNATQYLISGNKDLAIKEFLNAVDLNRETIETYFALGGLFRSNGEIDKAISIHRSLIARENLSESHRLRALKELAVDFDKGGFVDKAIETYKDVLKINRDQTTTLLALCRIYEDIEDWDEAYNYRVLLSKVGRENQSETISHILVQKAKLHFDKGSFQDCSETLDDAFRYAPSVSAKILRLKLYIKDGALDSGKHLLLELLKEHAMYTSFIFESLEEGIQRDGEDKENYQVKLGVLKEYFLKLEDRDLNSSASVVLAKVRLLKDINQNENAYELLNQYMEESPNYSEALNIEYIQLLVDLGKDELAIDSTKKLINNMHRSLAKHYCSSCGFNSDEIFWRCPQCHQWETIQFRWKV